MKCLSSDEEDVKTSEKQDKRKINSVELGMMALR